MKGGATWVLMVGVLVLLAVGGNVQKPKKAAPSGGGGGIDRSLDSVNPRFAAKVRVLLARMGQRGFSAKILETHRSEERAAQLEAKGTGKARSMHARRVAVDIGENDATPWVAAPGFWEALHEEALAVGLYRVKRREKDGVLRWDLPHVQALPGSMDAKVWAMGPDAIDALLAQHYA